MRTRWKQLECWRRQLEFLECATQTTEAGPRLLARDARQLKRKEVRGIDRKDGKGERYAQRMRKGTGFLIFEVIFQVHGRIDRKREHWVVLKYCEVKPTGEVNPK